MLSVLALTTVLAAVNPWEQNDPFPLPATYASLFHRDGLSANLGYRGVFENWEVDGNKDARPYEAWQFFSEADPFLRYSFSPQAELKAGARVKATFGGDVTVLPRIAYVDDRPEHTFIFGNYRASWNPGILYQPLSADDHTGALFRIGRRLRLEGLVSRPDAVGNNRYERYVAAGRFGWAGDFLRLEGQGLIEHAAGFDTADLPYKRPSVPDHQALQTGLYGEVNFLGRHSGVHAEVQHTAGTVLWQGKKFKPHGRYRAVGGHLSVWNLTATAEYRRVDPTFIAPQGAYEYRQLYPDDRHRAPDEAVGQLKWFYPFHPNASVNVEVEQGFWTKMKSLDSVANQNRVALALQAQF